MNQNDNKMILIQNKFTNLPEYIQMGLFSFIAVPLLLVIASLGNILSPVSLTPDMLPGAFHEDGTLNVVLFYKLFAILSAGFIGLIRCGQNGSLGFMCGAILQYGLAHLFS